MMGAESKDPEGVSFAMLGQGVLLIALSFTPALAPRTTQALASAALFRCTMLALGGPGRRSK